MKYGDLAFAFGLFSSSNLGSTRYEAKSLEVLAPLRPARPNNGVRGYRVLEPLWSIAVEYGVSQGPPLPRGDCPGSRIDYVASIAPKHEGRMPARGIQVVVDDGIGYSSAYLAENRHTAPNDFRRVTTRRSAYLWLRYRAAGEKSVQQFTWSVSSVG